MLFSCPALAGRMLRAKQDTPVKSARQSQGIKPTNYTPGNCYEYNTYNWDPTRLTLVIVQELCESRGGRPGLSVLTSLLVSVDVKLY